MGMPDKPLGQNPLGLLEPWTVCKPAHLDGLDLQVCPIEVFALPAWREDRRYQYWT